MKHRNRKILLYISLLFCIILLIDNISELDFKNLSNGPIFRPLSYLFFALVFIIQIREQNRKSE